MPHPVHRFLLALCAALLASALHAQSSYRHLDAGRPVRVEDAGTTERYAFELQLAALRVERLAGGVYRRQVSPKLSYGVLPRTEIEIRTPIEDRPDPAGRRRGLAGVGVGGQHVLWAESARWPALGAGVEMLLPVGPNAPPQATITAKLLATRSFAAGRLHVNGAVGTFGAPPAPLPCTPGAVCADSPLIPYDPPCSVQPAATLATGTPPPTAASPSSACARHGAARARTAARAAAAAGRRGQHWQVGVGVDRSVALRSLLIAADVYAEHYRQLGQPVSWTAEMGARRQMGPRIVVDATVGHRFRGAYRSWTVAAAFSVEFALRALIPDGP